MGRNNKSALLYPHGLTAHWTFDEREGCVVRDQVTGHSDPVHYVFQEAVYKPSTDPERRPGICGGALLFDGYSTWIHRRADFIPAAEQEMTISCWVAPRSFGSPNAGGLFPIVSQYDPELNQGYLLGLYQYGQWSFQVGVDGEWHQIWSRDVCITREKWSFVSAVINSDEGCMRLCLNGEKVADSPLPRGVFSTDHIDLYIGKNPYGLIIGEVFNLNMYCGLLDELLIYNRALTEKEIHDLYERYLQLVNSHLPVPDVSLNRAVYQGDRHRPVYHFMPPGHWMNEPHAPLYFKGQYHLFYQQNGRGPYWHEIHWGHAVSEDMVHWRDLPLALTPEKEAVDPDGDWSGSAAIDDDGRPVLFFTAANEQKESNQMTGLARCYAEENNDVDLVHWDKYPHPVTVQEKNLSVDEGEVWFGQFRDPFVWKEGDEWYQLVGSGLKMHGQPIGGTALLYRSHDLVHWTFANTFFTGDYRRYPETGQVWELPVLLPLGKDKQGENKYVFLINPWYEHLSPHNVKYVWYWLGTWDKRTYTFQPEQKEPQLFDVGEHFTGPSGLVDPKGRAIVFSIAQGKRTHRQEHDAGWAHNGGLPVHLYLRDDGQLGVDPIGELQTLRGKQLVSITEPQSLNKVNEQLVDVEGDCLEIEVEIDPGQADAVGLYVRRSPTGEEQTLMTYKSSSGRFEVDRTQSSLEPETGKGVQGGQVDLGQENVKLRVYLDKSMVEAYLNGLKSLTTRVYPTREDARGLAVWADTESHTVQVVNLNIWEMTPAYA